MKKYYILFLFILLIGTSPIYSQYQSIFGNTQSSWKMDVRDMTPEFVTCWSDSMWVEYNQDTNFQNKVFKPLFREFNQQNSIAIGFISEDTTSGKLWFRNNHLNDTNLHLLMDMSLTATDSFYFDYGSFGSYKVAVDTIYYLNSRKIIELEEGEFIVTNQGTYKFVNYLMIEGVGVNNRGVNKDQSNSLLQNHWKDNVLNYSAPVDSFFVCDSLTSIKKETWVDETFEVHPNPINSKANLIQKEFKADKIELFDINGRLVKNFSPTENELNFADVGNGFYFIIITTENNTRARKKIVVRR